MSTDKKRAKSSGQFRPFLGYLLACLTSGLVIAIAIAVMENISRTTPKPWDAARLFRDAIALTLFTAPIVMTVTFLPAVPFVWWSDASGTALRRSRDSWNCNGYRCSDQSLLVIGYDQFHIQKHW